MFDPRVVVRRLRSAILPHPALSGDVLRLATPVTLGMLTFTLLSIVDTAMLGRLGSTPLAAAGVAGVLYFAVVFPISALSVGVQCLVARRFGEDRRALCGQVLNTGLVLCVALGLPLVLAAPWLARLIAPLASNDPQVVDAAAAYLHYRLLGSSFMLFNAAAGGFFAGTGRVRHQLAGSIAITAANILLDYALIFGRAGFPRLEVEGAAIASTIALGVGTLYYAIVLALPDYRARFGTLSRPWFVSAWLRPMIRLSTPILAQRAVSNTSWSLFFAIVARIGTIELAATNVIRSIYHLSIMIAVGLGIASAALVGQNLGANKPERAEQLAWESVKLVTSPWSSSACSSSPCPSPSFASTPPMRLSLASDAFPSCCSGWYRSSPALPSSCLSPCKAPATRATSWGWSSSAWPCICPRCTCSGFAPPSA
jgi:multidrug resistance protein, MATE family